MLSNGRHEVAVRPELATPQLLLDVRAPLEHLAGQNALERAHDLGRAVGGHALQQKMHMISIGANFQEVDLEPLADLQAHLLERRVHARVEHHAAILGRAYQVVDQNRHVVALVDVSRFGHSTSLNIHLPIPQQAAGYSTQSE